MKIGIVLHSQTGNTLDVGNKILETLEKKGHLVTLICIKNIETSNSNRIQLDCIPKINGYDAIIFGAWVQAFNLCPGFNIYLKQLSDLEIKSVSCFLTQYFPYKWMGGSNALLKLSKLLKSKDIKVNFSGIINWSNKQRNAQIEALADLISSTYSG